MAYVAVDAIEVWAWGLRVGAVALDPVSGYYAFEYEPTWRSRNIELAPTTMPTSARPFVFPALPELTYRRLPAMLADALPDDFGNALIDAYLANQGVARSDITPLDRLAYLANRGMGALEFRPPRGPRHRISSALQVAALVTSARGALAGSFDGDRETSAALGQLIQVGTSAGGARAKAVVAYNAETEEVRSGQVPADPGFAHWLLKLDGIGNDRDLGTTQNYGRIEYAYYLMARAAGINISDSRLLMEGGRAHFMTRRFDRDHQGKMHVQTLCAMAHLDFRQRATHDYVQYFAVIDDLALEPSARTEAFRRMAFNVAAANCDDHTKNFGFLLAERGRWALAPAYDVTHAYNPRGDWTFQHLMSVNGRFADITTRDLLIVADRYAVPKAKTTLREVLDAIDSFSEFATQAQLPAATAAELARDITAMNPRTGLK